jgi:hypothetical protein
MEVWQRNTKESERDQSLQEPQGGRGRREATDLFVESFSPADFCCGSGRFFSVGVWDTITSYFLLGLEKERDSCPMATTMASSFSESTLLCSTAALGREGVCC